jgi:hypothetical protein
MKLRINWSRFSLLFTVFLAMFYVAGCTAAWLTAISAMLPAIEAAVAAILSLVMSLEGKTVPAGFVATVQKIESDITAEIANIQSLVAAYKAAASTGLISQIEAVFQAVLANIQSILNDASITDSATVTKIAQFVGLAVAAVQAILAFFPAASAKMLASASKSDLKLLDKQAADAINSAHKQMQANYQVVVTATTANSDVNAALKMLPTTLP